MNERKYNNGINEYYFPHGLYYTPCSGLMRAESFVSRAIENYRFAEYPESANENEKKYGVIGLPYKNLMYTILYSEWAINSILSYYKNIASKSSKKQVIYNRINGFIKKYRSGQAKKEMYRLFRYIQINSFDLEHYKHYGRKNFFLDSLQVFDNMIVGIGEKGFTEQQMRELSNCAKDALKAIKGVTSSIDEIDELEKAGYAVFFPFIRKKENRRADINKKIVYPLLGIELY